MNTQRMMLVLVLLVSVLLDLGGTAAADQIYSWTDADGVVHFGDTPGEAGATAVLRDLPAEPPAAGAGSAAAEIWQPEPSPGQQRREELAQERELRLAMKQEEERFCELHRQRLETFTPSRRLLWTNEKGETVRIEEAERVEMVEESREYLEKNCQR